MFDSVVVVSFGGPNGRDDIRPGQEEEAGIAAVTVAALAIGVDREVAAECLEGADGAGAERPRADARRGEQPLQ